MPAPRRKTFGGWKPAHSTWQSDFATAMPGLSTLYLKCSCFSFSETIWNRFSGKEHILNVQISRAWTFFSNGRGYKKNCHKFSSWLSGVSTEHWCHSSSYCWPIQRLEPFILPRIFLGEEKSNMHVATLHRFICQVKDDIADEEIQITVSRGYVSGWCANLSYFLLHCRWTLSHVQPWAQGKCCVPK